MLDLLNYKGKPDRNRFISALKRRAVDRVPNFEMLIESEHVKKIVGKYIGDTSSAEADLAKIDKKDGYFDYSNIISMNANYFIDICNAIGQDVIFLNTPIYIPFKTESKSGKFINVPLRSVKNRKDFKKTFIDTENQIANLIKNIKNYREAIKNRNPMIGLGISYGPILQMLYEIVVGMNDFMIMVYEDKNLVIDMLDAETEHCIKMTQLAIRENLDFVILADDLAFKTGLFLPPKIMKEIWLPRMAKIIEPLAIKDIPILFHSDGKLDEIIKDLIDIGIDGINPVDPYSINYKEYKKKYGDYLSFSGNIDIEFPLAKGTTEDVKKDVIEHLKIMMPGGGYILSSSHSIVNYIPWENFATMINTVHEYGIY